MTRQSPPIVPERGVPLTAETVGLLQPGDWLLRRDGRATRLELELDGGLSGVYLDGSTHANSPLSHFTFLGRPDADGWIAHDGRENPAPGLRVDARTRCGNAFDGEDADSFAWSHGAPFNGGDIIAWRPHVAAAPALSLAETVVVPVEDVLFYKLKDLILEQSEGEWDDAMIVRDAHHFANHLRPLLSAAPAREPEGGAVDARAVAAILNPALFSHDKVEAHIAASPMSVTYARIDAVDAVRRVLDAAALIPKEAPAATGAGEDWTTLVKELRMAGCGLFNLKNDRGDYGYFDTIADRIEALRAQPQAREEAQPVAWRYELASLVHPDGSYDGWGLPLLAHEPPNVPEGSVRNLRALYFATPPSQPLAEGADAEKLRVAVEALEPFVVEAERIRAPYSAETIMDNVELWQCGSVEITRTRLTYGDLRRAHKALATLQQEVGE